MLLGVRSGSATRFFDGLMAGDPVAWIILGAMGLFGAFAAYRKYRTFSS
jgi:hypothetical protein